MQKTVEIPDGVKVELRGNELVVNGPKGELKRTVKGVTIHVSEDKVLISSGTERRKEKAMVGTWNAHTRNMITGVTRGWEAKLKVVYSHFPVKFKIEGDRLVIQNFMGGRKSRVAKTYGDVKVDVKKDEIVITGIDKENVGQTAASIELTTKVKGYDRRVFQDGCHLIQKCKPLEGKNE